MISRAALSLAFLAAAGAAAAATLPAGFVEDQITDGLDSPTAMVLTPDGRIFVCEQGGDLRVIEDNVLLPAPFVSLTVNDAGERGLLGVTLDPDFDLNGFVYVYYTATTPSLHNRVSRFTADGNVAVPGSEQILFELDALSGATNHNGGALHFGPDGKLYVAVGDNANGNNAQSLSTVKGKMLRLNPDGSIPTDNPFFDSTSGNNRAIWALGLRNPFTFSFHRFTGRMFINDVGQDTWEEINDGIEGSNYGWPDTEGETGNPTFRSPLFVYAHGAGGTRGCAITGGAFYDPASGLFPADYLGDYFFADYCNGWIRRYDPATDTATGFATGIGSPVDLKVTPGGSLYYLARGEGAVYLVGYTGSGAPNITLHPESQTVPLGQAATFEVTATGTPPLHYTWRRDGVDIPGSDADSYTLPAVQAGDDGAVFSVVVSNSLGSDTSDDAVLTVTDNTPPAGTIEDPPEGTLYRAGDLVQYAGTGTDGEDGALDGAAFTWRADFHHEAHTHPFVPPATGSTEGSFTIPTSGETASDVWYRIHLRVTDSEGLFHDSFRDVLPRTSTVTLATDPPGLRLRLDGQPVTAPHSFVGVEGIVRMLEAQSPQSVGGTQWVFESWSDGGAAAHSVSTPEADTTYTATFAAAPNGALQWSAAGYARSEGLARAVLTVRRVGSAQGAVSVTYATADGTAVAGEDYTATTGVLSFPPGARARNVLVPLLRDTVVEGDETFSVSLQAPTGGALLGSPSTAVVTVVDNDKGGALSFAAASFRRSEALSSATIRVVRTGGTASGVTVDYATVGGTATAGEDYTATAGTLSFGPGAMTATVTLPLLGDTVVEGNETIDLALSNPTGGATLGPRSSAVLTLVDDDRGGALSFQAARYLVAESGASATITVRRLGGIASGVTVDYATADGTATEGADYTATSGTLSFDAGVRSQTFTIPILDDALDEPVETLAVSLNNATGGARIVAPATALVRVRDDDGP